MSENETRKGTRENQEKEALERETEALRAEKERLDARLKAQAGGPASEAQPQNAQPQGAQEKDKLRKACEMAEAVAREGLKKAGTIAREAGKKLEEMRATGFPLPGAANKKLIGLAAAGGAAFLLVVGALWFFLRSPWTYDRGNYPGNFPSQRDYGISNMIFHEFYRPKLCNEKAYTHPPSDRELDALAAQFWKTKESWECDILAREPKEFFISTMRDSYNACRKEYYDNKNRWGWGW